MFQRLVSLVVAPKYLIDLLAVGNNSRCNFRSQKATLLVRASAQYKPTLGDRAFQAAAPKLWNHLPEDITNKDSIIGFNSALKTHIFRLGFT